jgi:hypothetical protein
MLFGVLLTALGGWAYSASDLEGALKFTALIPAGVGVILFVCGLVGLRESALKHAMHVAATVGLLGLLLGAGRFVPKVLREGFDASNVATVATGGMTLLCLVFVGLCIHSFIQARRRRTAREAAAV